MPVTRRMSARLAVQPPEPPPEPRAEHPADPDRGDAHNDPALAAAADPTDGLSAAPAPAPASSSRVPREAGTVAAGGSSSPPPRDTPRPSPSIVKRTSPYTRLRLNYLRVAVAQPLSLANGVSAARPPNPKRVLPPTGTVVPAGPAGDMDATEKVGKDGNGTASTAEVELRKDAAVLSTSAAETKSALQTTSAQKASSAPRTSSESQTSTAPNTSGAQQTTRAPQSVSAPDISAAPELKAVPESTKPVETKGVTKAPESRMPPRDTVVDVWCEAAKRSHRGRVLRRAYGHGRRASLLQYHNGKVAVVDFNKSYWRAVAPGRADGADGAPWIEPGALGEGDE